MEKKQSAEEVTKFVKRNFWSVVHTLDKISDPMYDDVKTKHFTGRVINNFVNHFGEFYYIIRSNNDIHTELSESFIKLDKEIQKTIDRWKKFNYEL